MLGSLQYNAIPNVENIESVEIADGVTSIGYGMFAGCRYLTSVTIHDNIEIGMAAFNGCPRLATVTITANGGDANNVRQMMLSAGVPSSVVWIIYDDICDDCSTSDDSDEPTSDEPTSEDSEPTSDEPSSDEPSSEESSSEESSSEESSSEESSSEEPTYIG